MAESGSPVWAYKIVIRRPDGSISLDHRLAGAPLPQLLEALRGEGWSLVHENEAPAPSGVQVTYTLRRPAPIGGESTSRSSS